MSNDPNSIVLLADAIGSPDFLQHLDGKGPYQDCVCLIGITEIERAAAICAQADPKSLAAELIRIGLRQIRETTSKSIKIMPNVPNIDESTIVVTNMDNRAIELQAKHNCKTIRFKTTLNPYTGFSFMTLDTAQAEEWNNFGEILSPIPLKTGEFVVFTNNGNSTYGPVGIVKDNKISPLNKRTINPSGITPKSKWQMIIIEMLLSDTCPICVIGARAGAGKTLLAIACALYLRSIGKIKHIVYVPPYNKDPAIPGNPEEKMAPYLHGLRDNLLVIDTYSRGSIIKPAAAVHIEEFDQLLGSYERIVDKIKDLNTSDITETLNFIRDHLSCIQAQIKQIEDLTGDEAGTNIYSEALSTELYNLLSPLQDAQRDLTSLRQGDMGKFLRQVSKSIKDAQKTIISTISPNIRKPTTTSDIIKRYGIEVMNITQLHSRSLADTFVIVDEAQFLQKSSIDNLGSRASTGSHIAFLGDARQTYDIDSTDTINGMLILTQTQKNSPSGSVLVVPPSVRSERLDSADFIQSLEGVSLNSIVKSMI